MPVSFRRLAIVVACLACSALLAAAQDKKADAPSLSTAQGVVDKADKESVTVKPRGADGKFQKTLVLKVTGTSKVSSLTPQKRGDKTVLTQRDVEPKDLESGQAIAVIYAEAGKDGPVLLTAVVQPAAGK
jgi:hypothetical protein